MTRYRDLEFERQATKEYSHGQDVSLLSAFAEARAGSYGLNLPEDSRDLRREALEELADARNYLVWWLQAIRDEIAEGDPTEIGHALAAVAVAWGALT